MFKLVKYGFLISALSLSCLFGYNKFQGNTPTASWEGLKIEVRNNKCRLLASDGKILLDMEATGSRFVVVSASSSYGTVIQGNRVRILDEDGQTTLCDMDYNGSVISVTNIHGLKITDVDVRFKMNGGKISGI